MGRGWTPAWADTIPRQARPRGGRELKRAVRILLECILVLHIFYSLHSNHRSPKLCTYLFQKKLRNSTERWRRWWWRPRRKQKQHRYRTASVYRLSLRRHWSIHWGGNAKFAPHIAVTCMCVDGKLCCISGQKAWQTQIWLLWPHNLYTCYDILIQGSHSDWKNGQGFHSDWKTTKNGKAISSQGKVREFWTDWKSQGKPHKILENWDKLR